MKHIMIGGMVESSAAALGCMRICRVPLEDARKVVRQALDLGIRLFDHADVYGFGKSGTDLVQRPVKGAYHQVRGGKPKTSGYGLSGYVPAPPPGYPGGTGGSGRGI